jgi:hypothetical protein
VVSFTVRLVPVQSSTINQQRELLQCGSKAISHKDKASHTSTVLAWQQYQLYDTTAPAAAVICNFQLSSMLTQHACFGVQGGQTPMNCSPAALNLSTTLCMQQYSGQLQRAATARLELETVSQLLHACYGQLFGQAELAACTCSDLSVAQTPAAAIAQASRQQHRSCN